MIQVEVKKLDERAILPTYGTEGSAGMDVHILDDIVIPPGEVKVAPTGLAYAVPIGYELQVRPRSGLSLKTGLRLPNSPGTIDSDYRGDLGIIMQNVSDQDLEFKAGDKVAQIVLNFVPKIELVEVDELDETKRADGGFGHTGVQAE